MVDRQGHEHGMLRRHGHRWLLVVIVVLAVVFVGRPALHLATTALSDRDSRRPAPPGFVDDASRMNQTAVSQLHNVPAKLDEAEAFLASLLADARRSGQKVSIGGARHTMGGHTIFPDGIVINMLPLRHMELHADPETLTVQAGAIWKDVIVYLDARGRSVSVMQSNHSFSVGGSISVNCHGWQFGMPPIASTVRSLRLMRPDGSIVRCSRDENAELFSLVLGGYGLFGIILDVDLDVVPNRRYRLKQFVVPADQSLVTLDAQISAHQNVEMVYARMNVTHDRFLDEVILYLLLDDPAPDGSIPELSEKGMVSLRRAIFRGSVDSEYGKRLRWTAEADINPGIGSQVFSRNQLQNEGVEVFQNRSSDTTDILHEYFLPRENAASFVLQMRRIIPRHQGNLLNVTVRSVETDEDTFLRYADRPMLSFVMLFNHARTEAADQAMAAMTRDLIDAALEFGGRYYLPYRLHALPRQFERAYPQARRFFELKRKYDPDEVFQNQFYLKYGQPGNVGSKTN